MRVVKSNAKLETKAGKLSPVGLGTEKRRVRFPHSGHGVDDLGHSFGLIGA